jgi:hypothetical protein
MITKPIKIQDYIRIIAMRIFYMLNLLLFKMIIGKKSIKTKLTGETAAVNHWKNIIIIIIIIPFVHYLVVKHSVVLCSQNK